MASCGSLAVSALQSEPSDASLSSKSTKRKRYWVLRLGASHESHQGSLGQVGTSLSATESARVFRSTSCVSASRSAARNACSSESVCSVIWRTDPASWPSSAIVAACTSTNLGATLPCATACSSAFKSGTH